MLSEHIYIKENTINKETCDEIINYFEENKDKQINGGVGPNCKYKPSVKKTLEICIESPKNEKEYLFYNIINNNFIYHLKEYTNKYNLNINNLLIKGLNIQKYTNNNGYFKSHNDFNIHTTYYRLFSFIYYLNDVDEGGETDMYFIKIKPTIGKLLIFPSDVIYQHEGNIPISNDKYIITGFIYNII